MANYAYTEQEINIAIGNASPTVYMAKVREQCESGETVYGGIVDLGDLCKNLEENAIPRAFLDGELFEYEDFLDARRKLMAIRLRDYYFSL